MNLTELIFNILGYDIYCTTNCTIKNCCTSYCIISCSKDDKILPEKH